MIAGALAYIVFMSQFVISSRLRFIERVIPQDRLLSLHGLSGMILAGLVLVHFLLKYVLVLRYGGVTLQSALGALAVLIYAVLAPLAILVLRGRKPRKGGSPPYEKNRKWHNLFRLGRPVCGGSCSSGFEHMVLAAQNYHVGMGDCSL
jgi:hypothetical protein